MSTAVSGAHLNHQPLLWLGREAFCAKSYQTVTMSANRIVDIWCSCTHWVFRDCIDEHHSARQPFVPCDSCIHEVVDVLRTSPFSLSKYQICSRELLTLSTSRQHTYYALLWTQLTLSRLRLQHLLPLGAPATTLRVPLVQLDCLSP